MVGSLSQTNPQQGDRPALFHSWTSWCVLALELLTGMSIRNCSPETENLQIWDSLFPQGK